MKVGKKKPDIKKNNKFQGYDIYTQIQSSQ